MEIANVRAHKIILDDFLKFSNSIKYNWFALIYNHDIQKIGSVHRSEKHIFCCWSNCNTLNAPTFFSISTDLKNIFFVADLIVIP
jgi:hypothetical protein